MVRLGAGGKDGIRKVIDALGRFDVLPCLTFTPPSQGSLTNAIPKDLASYARFVQDVLREFPRFSHVELWNEHNFPSDWRRDLDPRGEKFVEMIRPAAQAVRAAGRKVVLGGMDRLDEPWLHALCSQGILDEIDVLGFHSVENMSARSKFAGWLPMLARLRTIMESYGTVVPVWLTEVAYCTVNTYDEIHQVEHLRSAALAPVERVYWYALRDPDKKSLREHTEGVPDERHYHLGMAGRREKLLYRVWKQGGLPAVRAFDAATLDDDILLGRADMRTPDV